MKKYLEAGRLTSPRGLKGELKFDCWCDSPSFLIGVPKFFLDNEGKKQLTVKLYRPSVPSISFDGYDSRESVATLVTKTIYFDRDDITLPDGVYFNDDLIGLEVFDDESGEKIGELTEVNDNATSPFYTIKSEEKTYLVPAIKEFVKSISLEDGIRVKLIEGLDGLVK